MAARTAGDLGPRLNRILGYITSSPHRSHGCPAPAPAPAPSSPPQSQSVGSSRSSGLVVADIGTDHGHLAVRLSARADVHHVYATDISPHGAAHELFHKLPAALQSKLTLLTGDGLAPLESAGVDDCDTLVLSGMGARTAFQILCCGQPQPRQGEGQRQEQEQGQKERANWSTDYWAAPQLRWNHARLAALGVRRVVLAPWPPSFLPLQALLHLALAPAAESEDGGRGRGRGRGRG